MISSLLETKGTSTGPRGGAGPFASPDALDMKHYLGENRMECRFKDAHGDGWHVYRQPAGTSGTSKEGHSPGGIMRQPGFKFRNLRTSEMRFLKEEDAPKNLNLEKVDEDELCRLLDLATPI